MDNKGNDENKQYILVKVNEEQYGIDIQQVENIIKIDRITRVPKAPEFIKGVINLRGEIIPVMNLRMKFGIEEDITTADSRIIIVKVEEYEIGIIVDQVKEVIQIPTGSIEDIKDVTCEINSTYLQGVGKVNQDIVTIINLHGLIIQ